MNCILLNAFVGGCLDSITRLHGVHMDCFTFLLLFTLEEQNSFTFELVYYEQVPNEVMTTVNKWYLLSLQSVAYKYFTVRPKSVSCAAFSRSKLNGVPRRNIEVP